MGIDFTAESLGWLRGVVQSREDLRGRVQLHDRRPDQLDDLEPGRFDLVILNSVVQYFPGIGYLLGVLEKAQRLIRPGGKILLTDLGNLPLAGPLACSIELAHAEDRLSRGELLKRIRARTEREQELLVHPDLFTALIARQPRIHSAEVSLKRGRARNELVQYRYDVLLRLDRGPDSPRGDAIDWSANGPGAAEIAAKLDRSRPKALVLRGVANDRLSEDVACWKLAQDEAGPATVGELRAAVAAMSPAPAADPEDFFALGDGRPYAVSVAWSNGEPEGRFDVILRRSDTVGETERPRAVPRRMGPRARRARRRSMLASTPRMPSPIGPEWGRYANDPLAGVLSRRFAGELRAYLQQRLPAYMVPSAVVVLDALPRTSQGKLDRRALPPPPDVRPGWSGGYVAPQTEEESLVAGIWERLLGVSPIGVKDNFFELGGHSMLAVRMVAEIERRTGRRLPLAALFQQATVEHLARLLCEPDACAPESSLVPLARAASGRPFFAVHPAGGTVFCYKLLADSLEPARTFYGLQAVGIDGLRPPHENAVDMAAH